jgi:urease accessory protein
MKLIRPIVLAGALSLLVFSPALAHPGHDDGTFIGGLMHPLTGLDHIVAMISVGVLAARRGGKAMALWPLAFVSFMLAGYGLGRLAPGLSAEPGILASVIVLGTLTISTVNVPLSVGLVLIAAFGLCHGYAHGSEAPHGAGAGFPVGFATSTAALHGIGIVLGMAVSKLRLSSQRRAGR